MDSDNPVGAENQQERPGFEQWIVGFVDGEGCFSISVVRNRGCRLGWQVQHEFSVTQAASSRVALEGLGRYFECGRIVENGRHDNHREPLMRYSVKRRADLVQRIIPFFEEHPLMAACRGLDSWNPQRPYADYLDPDGRGEDMVRAPWRHGDQLERNSLSGKFRPARMAQRLGHCLNQRLGEIAM